MATTQQITRDLRGEPSEVARREPAGGQTIADMIERQGPAFARALPRHVPADMFVRTVLTLVRTNPELAKCTPESLLGALMTCAQLGLVPGPELGEAHLVPFFNGKTRAHEVTFIPGYQGLIKLAINTGHVNNIRARVVREGDRFEYVLGDDERIVHEPGTADGDDLKRAVAYYAIGDVRGGGKARIVMSRARVVAHRERFVRSKGGPWEEDFDAMACKTVLRALCKTLPKSPVLLAALDADDQVRHVSERDLGAGPVPAVTLAYAEHQHATAPAPAGEAAPTEGQSSDTPSP